MHDYFRGNPDGRQPARVPRATREPIRAEYRDRDARIAVLDEQGLEAVWLFPTLGMLYEELLKHDPEARRRITFTAFNRWLDEDWGFDYQDRIFAAPYITLADLDWAVAASSSGRSTAAPAPSCMRPAAPHHARRPAAARATRRSTRSGPASTRPASPSSCTRATAATRATATPRDGFAGRRSRAAAAQPHQDAPHRARRSTTSSSRSCSTSCSSASPNLRVASVENGAEFLRDLFRKLALDRPQDARLLHRGPGRDVPAPRLDQPVLGGRRRTRSSSSWAPTG